MTFFEYVKDLLSDEFSDRRTTGAFLGTISAIVSVALVLSLVIAIASQSLGPIWALLIIFGVMAALLVVIFIVYNFVYWLINRKDM
jgi:hypothetical protein